MKRFMGMPPYEVVGKGLEFWRQERRGSSRSSTGFGSRLLGEGFGVGFLLRQELGKRLKGFHHQFFIGLERRALLCSQVRQRAF